MRGLMMDRPLSIISLLQFASANHGEAEIVSKDGDGLLHVYTYRDCYRRVGRLANGLRALGVADGDRVATLAWNSHRHFELYYAISGAGAVCHTINPRLAPGQISYIINHACDKIVFVDPSLLPVLESIAGTLACVRAVVVMADRVDVPPTSLGTLHCYEDLVSNGDEAFALARPGRKRRFFTLLQLRHDRRTKRDTVFPPFDGPACIRRVLAR